MIFCFLEYSNKKGHLNIILFFISRFSKENYVTTRFSLSQGRKNQMVAFILF
jgi:hypothetical protein